jgi:MSHA biogenesis protein MshK
MAHCLGLRLMSPLLLLVASPVWAQLADPTRPPVQAAAPVGDAASSAAMPAATGLQSVILSRYGKGRPAAVINGEVVQLGGMVGEARLVKVEEDHVVLLNAGERETLRLMPAAEKVMKVGAGKTVGVAGSIGMNAVKGEKKK